jgi:hypothetical protein
VVWLVYLHLRHKDNEKSVRQTENQALAETTTTGKDVSAREAIFSRLSKHHVW